MQMRNSKKTERCIWFFLAKYVIDGNGYENQLRYCASKNCIKCCDCFIITCKPTEKNKININKLVLLLKKFKDALHISRKVFQDVLCSTKF